MSSRLQQPMDRKLKTVCRLVTDRAVDAEERIGLENLESWSGRLLSGESDFAGEGIAFQRGDILFGKLRPYLAKAWVADRSGSAVGDFLVLRPYSNSDPNYLLYYLLTREVIAEISSAAYGSKMPRASWDSVREIEVPMPDLEQQRAVSTYLDRETAEIDAFIADQEELIGLLTERRSATISHAVTKGLDPSAPTKDSGVDWFGQIPASWQRTRLKRLAARVTDGAHISPETNGGVHPFVSTRDVREGSIDLEGSLRTTPETYRYMVATGCQPRRNDVLFSKDGTVGRTAIVATDEPFVVASSLIIISPLREIDVRYLNFLLVSTPLQEQVAAFVKGAGLPRISIANLERIVALVPPSSEQCAIADYLDQETAELDAAIADAREAIALSRERRAALISAAVTGKIDVRGAA